MNFFMTIYAQRDTITRQKLGLRNQAFSNDMMSRDSFPTITDHARVVISTTNKHTPIIQACSSSTIKITTHYQAIICAI